MATNNVYQNNVAYGLNQPTLNTPPMPIISNRAPTVNDRALPGQMWIFVNALYILTSTKNNISTWVLVETGGGSGVFASLEATTGNITADAGNIIATLGSVSAHTTVTAGSTITAGTGITATTGNISATAGSISAHTTLSAGTTVTAGTGITATTGNIVASTGDINATIGDVNAAGSVGAGTSLSAGTTVTAGTISIAPFFRATADDAGMGSAGTTEFTGALNANSINLAGTLTVSGTTGMAGGNLGFIKIWVGTTEYFIPFFDTTLVS